MAEGQTPRSGGASRAFAWLVSVAVIFALGGLVLYLASEINSRRYRLRALHGELVVEKGRLLPMGYEPYVPKAEALLSAYEPIPLPAGETFPQAEEYDDRADLDRALFAVLAGWARKGMESQEPEALKRATYYIERSELLPGLSEQQRIDLKALRADLAYRRGRRMIDDIGQLLVEALAEFRLAKELGTSRPSDVDAWIKDLEERIAAYGPKNLPAEKPAEPSAPVAPSRVEEEGSGAANPKPDKQGESKWRL